MTTRNHVHQWVDADRVSQWKRVGALRERETTRIPTCRTCPTEREARRPRLPRLIEVEADAPDLTRLGTTTAHGVASLIRTATRGRPRVGADAIINRAVKRGHSGAIVEATLDALMHGGLIRLAYRLQAGQRRLYQVHVADAARLEDFVNPGVAAARAQATSETFRLLKGNPNPAAAAVRTYLESPAAIQASPLLIRAAGIVADHAAKGDSVNVRVLSATRLSDSKALGSVRTRLERILGPLEHLGIRDAATLVLLGGAGRLEWPNHTIDLRQHQPFLGLSRETLSTLTRVSPGNNRLFAIENLAVFEACARGDLPDAQGAMVLWLGGWPGRGEVELVRRIVESGVRVSVWADLDWYGVGIARLVHSIHANLVETYRMQPHDLIQSPVQKDLPPAQLRLIAQNLEKQPNAILAETLRAMAATGKWAEHEALLAPEPKPLSR